MVVAYTNFPNEMAATLIDEIISGSTIRFTIIDEVKYLSVRDFIMHVCEKDNNEAGQVWRRMSEEEKENLKPYQKEFKFPGRGQQDQPVITFPGALLLVGMLPGKNAEKHRAAITKIVIRYFAGDSSLIEEVESNAKSNEPVAQMARDSLPTKKKDTELQVSRKRQYEQLEYEERVVALERTQAENLKIKADAMKQQADTYAKKIELYAGLCDSRSRMDDRGRLLFKDVVMNSVKEPVTGTLIQSQISFPRINTAKEQAVEFLTISTVASEMGYKLDRAQLMAVGMAVKNAYTAKYGREPPKHDQFVGGEVRRVNTYRARDRDIMESEIQKLVGGT